MGVGSDPPRAAARGPAAAGTCPAVRADPGGGGLVAAGRAGQREGRLGRAPLGGDARGSPLRGRRGRVARARGTHGAGRPPRKY